MTRVAICGGDDLRAACEILGLEAAPRFRDSSTKAHEAAVDRQRPGRDHREQGDREEDVHFLS